ncbi:hypothetical protein F2P81_005367 [Scophthalmus maximus]|uniref:Uncharacterized protein n=1 Tax=Scophthalmus maximus TaxID=52904 RepID=A0A6A4T9F1_SCOMX|nr:hypothetical protein F2P81_005367 [Scophthalmus maximus]
MSRPTRRYQSQLPVEERERRAHERSVNESPRNQGGEENLRLRCRSSDLHFDGKSNALFRTLHEDDTNSFQKTTARDHSTDDGRTGTCSAERGAHKALRGPSGRGLRGEMNLTNHRPSPGDISSTRH